MFGATDAVACELPASAHAAELPSTPANEFREEAV